MEPFNYLYCIYYYRICGKRERRSKGIQGRGEAESAGVGGKKENTQSFKMNATLPADML